MFGKIKKSPIGAVIQALGICFFDRLTFVATKRK